MVKRVPQEQVPQEQVPQEQVPQEQVPQEQVPQKTYNIIKQCYFNLAFFAPLPTKQSPRLLPTKKRPKVATNKAKTATNALTTINTT
jgi:hypothetical protein